MSRGLRSKRRSCSSSTRASTPHLPGSGRAQTRTSNPLRNPRPGPDGRRSRLAWLFGIAALVLGATFVLEGTPPEDASQAPAKAQAAPVPVTVAEVSTRDVPIYLDGLGTVQASNTVAIRSQVDGKLQSVNFVEGQQVKKGDILAVVDQRPFQAVLDQAKAKRAEDEAQLVSDQKDLDRFQDLVRKGAGTQQAVDQQQAKVDNLKATIEADQAGIESAETQLSYATITAPIDGRVGFRQVDAGNIVHANDATPITVLTADQADLGHLHAAAARPGAGARGDAQGRGAGARLRSGQYARARQGHAAAHRQPDRPVDEHHPAQGIVPQRGRAAVAGRVRARARAGRIR